MKPKLTKEAIKRLYASPVHVRLWNGCFNRAIATANFARHRFELSVEVTHPFLKWQCGNKDEVCITHWTNGGTGHHIDIPDELLDLVHTLKIKATMSDEKAMELSKGNYQAFSKSLSELGLTVNDFFVSMRPTTKEEQ